MLFNRKPKQQPAPLTITTGMMGGIPVEAPLVTIAGLVPPGSEGNAIMATCFDQISQAVDIQSSARRLLVYDMTNLRYEFGDHLGAFLWNLPALLDGVAMMIVARGETRSNLESSQHFVGSWLPVGFYDSLDAIAAHIRDGTQSVQELCRKREACSQAGRVFKPGETAVKIVLLGSRQTGEQFRTRQRPREDCDLDCGVIGGPKELALLTMKMRSQTGRVPNVAHPPIKTFSSAEEAVDQGLYVIMPKA